LYPSPVAPNPVDATDQEGGYQIKSNQINNNNDDDDDDDDEKHLAKCARDDRYKEAKMRHAGTSYAFGLSIHTAASNGRCADDKSRRLVIKCRISGCVGSAWMMRSGGRRVLLHRSAAMRTSSLSPRQSSERRVNEEYS